MSKKLDESKEIGRKVWESLLDQLAEVLGFFGAFMNSFKDVIRKHLLWAVVFGLIGAISFSGFYYSKPKVYRAQMTVSYNNLEKKIYADKIVKIDALVKSDNYKKLSELLNIPTNELENLISVESYNIHHETLTEDLSTEHIPFYIEVKVQEVAILDNLQEALVEYLNSSDYLLKRKDYLLAQNKAELDFLNKRMVVLDSLSKLILVDNNSISQQDAQKEIDFNKEILDLFAKIKVVNSNIHFNSNIEVLDGFVINNKPIGKSLKYFILLGFVIGLGFRMMVLFFSMKSVEE